MTAQCVVQVDQQDFVARLAAVRKIARAKAAPPVLGHIALEVAVAGKEFILRSTDRERHLSCRFRPINVEGDGGVAVPATRLYEWCKVVGDGSIDMEIDEYGARLSWGNGRKRATFKGYAIDEFFRYSPRRDHEVRELLRVESDKFALLVKQVEKFAATDDSRPTLTAVHMHLAPDGMHMLTTDGYRLGYTARTDPLAFSKTEEMLVPISTLSLWAQIYDAPETAIGTTAESLLVLTTGTTQLLSSTLAGTAMALPAQPESNDYTDIVFHNVEELLRALKIVKAAKGTVAAAMRVTVGEGEVVLSRRSEDADTRVPLEASITGQPAEFAISLKYFEDVLHSIGSSIDLRLRVFSPTLPLWFSTTQFPDWRALVMPMNMGQ